jgi:hypothetical protein
VAVREGLGGLSKALKLASTEAGKQNPDATLLWIGANMYLALILLSMLAFLALCLVGLFTLIRQAIADPPSSSPPVFIQDPFPLPAVAALSSAARSSVAPSSPAPTYAARSEDAEGSACGQSCA